MKNINEILERHYRWLKRLEGGIRADLRGTDLRDAKLGDADLSGAYISGADLTGANLSDANLSETDLRDADISYANIGYADLRYADLSGAKLRQADIRGAALCRADLLGADLNFTYLRETDLSQCRNVLSQIDYMNENFEKTKHGYIAYKTFDSFYNCPDEWKISEGSTIKEVVNFDRCEQCGNGINVAPLKWVEDNIYKNEIIWKVLIKYEWLSGICVPYNTDGKIRCERVKLIEVV